MIFGIGTDIVQVKRMSESLDKHGDRFAKRILAEHEFVEFTDYKNKSSFLAKRFAAKEAAVKALGTGFRDGISMTHISVDHDDLGKPLLMFTEVAKQKLQEQEIRSSHISIADEKEFAVAYVILEK